MKKLILTALCLTFLLSSYVMAQAPPCPKPQASDREIIIDGKKPNSYFVKVVVNRKWGLLKTKPYTSSGVFVSPNVILTAGHTLDHHWIKSRIISIDLYLVDNTHPGSLTKIASFNKKELKMFVNPVFHKKNGLFGHGYADYDYAYVALPKNISAGYLTLADYKDLGSATDSLYISGYPGDKAGLNLWQKGDLKSNIISDSTLFKYFIYTHEGDSGAPIWMTVNDRYYVVGVHNTGDYKDKVNKCFYNAGVRLNADRITEINSFINANKLP